MFVIAENNSNLPQHLKVSLPKLSAWPAIVNYTLLCFLKVARSRVWKYDVLCKGYHAYPVKCCICSQQLPIECSLVIGYYTCYSFHFRSEMGKIVLMYFSGPRVQSIHGPLNCCEFFCLDLKSRIEKHFKEIFCFFPIPELLSIILFCFTFTVMNS